MPIYAYLTIDDGPSSDFLDKLNLLDQNHSPLIQEPVANMILMHDFSGTMAYELLSNMVKVLVEKEIHFLSCAD
jgi:hypothetical protein